MKLAICYAGQGAQKTGMGKNFYENNAVFRAAFDRASSGTGVDIKKACFENPDDVLTQTAVTQPALVAFGSAMSAVFFSEGILRKASYVFGLSLGEYTALQAAGVWSPEDAVRIAAFRGKAMADAAEGIDCAMSAVIGLQKEDVENICANVMADVRQAMGQENTGKQSAAAGAGTRGEGTFAVPGKGVFVTNDNCPGQIVISGDSASVALAGEKAKGLGARVMSLHVSGPFHTPWMAPAGEALAELFRTTAFGTEQIPVIHNFTARPLKEGESLSDLLVAQVQHGVRMRESIDWLLAEGVDTFLEVGPGHTITGFVKKCAKAAGKDVTTLTVEVPEDLEKVKDFFSEAQVA